MYVPAGVTLRSILPLLTPPQMVLGTVAPASEKLMLLPGTLAVAVVVQQGRGEFRSERIVYNTDSGEITGGTDAPGGGVHMIVQPKAKAAKADKPAADKNAEKKD